MSWEWNDNEHAFYFLGEKINPDIRTIEQMRPVLYNENSLGPQEAYYMYRNVSLPEHEELVKQHELRYDITVIPPAKYGSEYVKTKGHFHPLKGGYTYPEIYEVLSGEAHYLFQNKNQVVVYEASAGEQVIVPPNFGHVTINPSEKTLVMANWVSPVFQADYGPFIKKHGAAFYELQSGWVENPRYIGFSITHDKPGKHNCPFYTKQKSMYDLFVEEPNLFSFLNNPDEYRVL